MAENKQQVIAWQVVFNQTSKAHVELMDWVMEQTKNRSAFIRETLMLRKMGAFNRTSGSVEIDNSNNMIDFDKSEIMNLINV